MKTIQTVGSRLKRADGTNANGILTVSPSAPFTYTEAGIKTRITQNVVSTEVIDGVLTPSLTLAPCRGTGFTPATVYYIATLTFRGVSETQHWVIADTDVSPIEITDVTQV